MPGGPCIISYAQYNTMFLFLLSFLAASVLCNDLDPVRLSCPNTVLDPPSKWPIKYPTTNHFVGFFKATGTIFVNLQPVLGYELLPVFNVTDSLWHQYIDNNDVMWGEFYMNIPGAGLALVSRIRLNPLRGDCDRNSICQKFVAPSPADLIDSYSELEETGKGYTQALYYSTAPASRRWVFRSEFYHWATDFTAATNILNEMTNGNSTVHGVHTVSHFYFERTDAAGALTLGYSGANPSPFSDSTRGFHAGYGCAIPREAIPSDKWSQLGLN